MGYSWQVVELVASGRTLGKWANLTFLVQFNLLTNTSQQHYEYSHGIARSQRAPTGRRGYLGRTMQFLLEAGATFVAVRPLRSVGVPEPTRCAGRRALSRIEPIRHVGANVGRDSRWAQIWRCRRRQVPQPQNTRFVVAGSTAAHSGQYAAVALDVWENRRTPLSDQWHGLRR